ncbi:MAG: IPT/TIG domain-containing protein [Candidatus Obscuribacterales bacterium]|nr:IPT/TIG domain-containing protein [Candidatus Obscuribacterales bacterium]
MYKSALGALALSLSLGLAVGAAGAQTQQRTASSASAPASSPTDGIQTYGSQKAATEVPSNGGNPNPTAAPAATTNAAPASAPKSKTDKADTKTASAAVGTNAKTTDGAAAPARPKRKPDEMLPVQASKPMVSTKLGWQTFEDYITLKQGQDQIPLTMTVTNSGYQSLVLHLNGSKLATEKDFKTNTLAMQMAGALAVGDNKFVIQAFGKPGSKVSWTLETPRAVITDIQPTTKGVANKVTISGRNFAKTIAGDQVQVGAKWATVLSGDSRKVLVTLPTGLSGKQKVVVLAGGFASKPYEYELKAAPVVTGLDFVSAPPGQAIIIMGSGFSPVAKDNIATIGGVPATITSCTPTQLNVVIPEMYYPQWNVPVVVKIGTAESNKNIMINIQTRVIPNDGAGEM